MCIRDSIHSDYPNARFLRPMYGGFDFNRINRCQNNQIHFFLDEPVDLSHLSLQIISAGDDGHLHIRADQTTRC